ncbi:MAG: outer membrane beta-barrel protein [Gemmatimonadota bacterium]|nr:outer membrane beta-barrel protein [Gemmatimonadota bacterium]
MKRVALVLSLALAIPAAASAQVGFGAAAGASFPMGDFGKGSNTGYHAQVSVDVGVPLSPIGFRFDGTLDHFDASGNTSTSSASARIAGAAANVLMGFGAVPLLGPYLIGGVGYYQLHGEGTFGGTPFSTSQSEPGGSIGAGIRFGLGGFGVFAETGYHFIKSTGTGESATTFVPVMFGVSF